MEAVVLMLKSFAISLRLGEMMEEPNVIVKHCEPSMAIW